ncbi:response regulator transcription factor [Arcobacter sp. F2176]|uniref:response regulator transcription factor n=1 Tax=unclassified Arcobacter TaxID=2593671 RepID=UPI00100AC190|nr:response regulator [Arcobacter sp. F2176]RXJ81896.1 DNA-binding response regulator [Arcobacter sp. F2176]|eukprot:TRINITY_DN13614_c0_g1_i1.p1 TRINITY_DN13614_c0_g1~~TRINITY_DN13614_c0_g1_i1.p1  ORF type:complete len:225 (-),score=-48.23 TRINITY_DN13614_c0_g1_i1:430-1104(-)
MKNLKNIKILYIDDEQFIREDAVEYLSFYCDNVYEASDGLDGLEKYKELKPDIIITDIKMPKLNGIEMIKEIRKSDKNTKIIIATAFLETSYLLEAIELGLIKYLVKPIMEDALLPVLESCTDDIIQKSSIFNICGGYKFDILNQTLFLNKEQISLTKKELHFLELLIKNSKRAVKYDEFSSYVWDGYMTEDALRAIVRELRKKISKQSIKNISGIGYQINLIG